MLVCVCVCVLVYTVFPQNIQPAPSTAQPSRVSFHRPTLRSGREPITLSPQAQLALVTAGSAVRSLFCYGKYVRAQCGCNASSMFVFALVQLCLGEAGRQEAQASTETAWAVWCHSGKAGPHTPLNFYPSLLPTPIYRLLEQRRRKGEMEEEEGDSWETETKA